MVNFEQKVSYFCLIFSKIHNARLLKNIMLNLSKYNDVFFTCHSIHENHPNNCTYQSNTSTCVLFSNKRFT